MESVWAATLRDKMCSIFVSEFMIGHKKLPTAMKNISSSINPRCCLFLCLQSAEVCPDLKTRVTPTEVFSWGSNSSNQITKSATDKYMDALASPHFPTKIQKVSIFDHFIFTLMAVYLATISSSSVLSQ